MKRVLGVIPARYKSERLPGKPLRNIGNKPMVIHTLESASKSDLINELVVLTDDERIYNTVRSYGGNACMTPVDLKSGTDRAAYYLKNNPGYDVVVNIQGDEPFIKSKLIDATIEPFINEEKIDVVTPASLINSQDDINNPACVKVVFTQKQVALYFSRAPIPFYRDENSEKIYYKHIGLYTYSSLALLKLSELLPSPLENKEKLEQLRMLENGFIIKVILTDYNSISVDTEEDLIKANKYLKTLSD